MLFSPGATRDLLSTGGRCEDWTGGADSSFLPGGGDGGLWCVGSTQRPPLHWWRHRPRTHHPLLNQLLLLRDQAGSVLDHAGGEVRGV